jgi:transcription antitermination protein NusB
MDLNVSFSALFLYNEHEEINMPKTKATQHDKRTHLMQALYQYDLYGKEVEGWFYPFESKDEVDEFQTLISQLTPIDLMISNHLENYSLNRLSYIDRAILRLATYELKTKGLEKEIVINEALNLTKEFSNLEDDKQRKFNNKVLDQIAKG